MGRYTQAALLQVARGLLSEEAIRCAVATIKVELTPGGMCVPFRMTMGNQENCPNMLILGWIQCVTGHVSLQLRHIPLDKDSRQQLRLVWTTLVDQYLREGAPYPVNVRERSVVCSIHSHRFVVKHC